MEIIKTNEALCIGCDRCVRECPIETANVTYRDKGGNIRVSVDKDRCINCGRCLDACHHRARIYTDDTERLIDDLKGGAEVSVIVAPSIKTNIPEYKHLFTYLKTLGVRGIYDVSQGADICVWAHLRHIEGAGAAKLITSPCPVIVNYCEKYNHKLLPLLSPVHSPMACMAIYLKKYKNVKGSIAVLSPCPAKADEFNATKLADYTVTFEELLFYLSERGMQLPDEETEFDEGGSDLGSLFPKPGGLKENIEYFVGSKYHIAKADGIDAYKLLDKYAQTQESLYPDILDILNCESGCNLGPANARLTDTFDISKTLFETSVKAADDEKREYLKSVHARYDEMFDLSDFLRTFSPVDLNIPTVTDGDISQAFALLGKDDFDAQNINCGACGNYTCYEMAKMVAQGVNIPENCIIKAKDDAIKQHQLNLAALGQLAAYEKMHAADLRTKMILELNPQINLLFDSSYNIVTCNAAAYKAFGFTSEDEMIKGFAQRVEDVAQDFRPDGSRILVADRLDEAVKNDVVRFELEMIIDGHRRFFDIELKKIPYENSYAIIAYAHDKTDVYERERQLVIARQKAEVASNAKSQFFNNMSHEIRTPMNAIIGMATIAQSTDDVDKKNYAIEKIRGASEHLLGIINNVLDMSKIEASMLELSNVEFSFDSVVKMASQIVSHRIEQQRQEFTVRIDEKIPPVLIGDDQRLSQVIVNLLSNAAKFTPSGGKIHLDAKLLSKHNGICWLQVFVEDTGIGIKPEHIKHIFNVFEQLDVKITRKYGGSGLGLALSRNIVHLLGGDIWVVSEYGKGAKFTFDVVLGYKTDEAAREAAAEGEGAGAEAAGGADKQEDAFPDFSKYCVLIVEDMDINCEIVETLLEPTGIATCCVQSGEDALEIIRAEPDRFDFILMDIQMPGINGYETTAAIREMDWPGAKTIPIVAMTADAFREDVERCLKAGMNGHIGKPVYQRDIINQLKQWLK